MTKPFFIITVLSFVLFASCKKDVIWVPDGYGAAEVTKPSGAYTPDTRFKSIAYCWHTNKIAQFDTAKLAYVTHLHFTFLYPKEDGSLQTLTDFSNFEQLNTLAKANNLKTAFSLAGDEKIYRTIMANEVTRKIFIKNVVAFAVRYDLDGIDIDWEYPRANYGNDVSFEILMKELSAELHSWHKYLSMATTAGLYAGPVKEGITQGAIDAVDFVNLMAYDGATTDPANPNHHSTVAMAKRVLDIWLGKGVPKEKAVLGIPLYGKTNTASPASMTYSALLAADAVPDAEVFTSGSNTYYYNGPTSVKEKTTYAKEKGNGVMFWEYGQDAKAANSLIKAAFDASR